METGLNIGVGLPDEHVSSVADAISTIFEAAYNNRVEQAVIARALATLEATTKIENVTITGCTITGDRVVEFGE